jgi:hypothetical protein
MLLSKSAVRQPVQPSALLPHRRPLVGADSSVAAGHGGTIQLVAVIVAPPVPVLPPALSSWIRPRRWLSGMVALTTTTAWLPCWRSPPATAAAFVSACTLAFEMAVQMPFLGPNWLLASLGVLAAAFAVLAVRAYRQAQALGGGKATIERHVAPTVKR